MVINNVILCMSVGFFSCCMLNNAPVYSYNDDNHFDESNVHNNRNVRIVNLNDVNAIIRRAENGDNDAIDDLETLTLLDNNIAFNALMRIAENGEERAIMQLDGLFRLHGNAEALDSIIRCAENNVDAAFLYLGTIAFNNGEALDCLLRCAERENEPAFDELNYIGQHCNNVGTVTRVLDGLLSIANNGSELAAVALSSISNYGALNAMRTIAFDYLRQSAENGNQRSARFLELEQQ